MRATLAAAVIASGLLAMGGPAWADTDAQASARCVQCHDTEDLPDMSQSAHAYAADRRTPSCIACHGPSPTHVDKPAGVSQRPAPDRVFSKNAGLPAQQRSEVCMSCHRRDAKRMRWDGSAHHAADVACSACHQIHANRDKVMSRAGQTEVCYRCHKAQRAELSRVSHHPVAEEKMSCSDCHNAHGSSAAKLLNRDNTNDTCYDCHAEKRGPFVHAHEPVAEDCLSCHNAHGSSVAGLLKARPPMLCQQCHTPHVAGGVGAVGGQPGVLPPAVAGQTAAQIGAATSGKNVVNLWQGRSCMNCHTQVHGSNNPAATNPTPQFLLR
jgi:DmsE family decaheme c-type cytochrome